MAETASGASTKKLEAWQTWPRKPEDVAAEPAPLIGVWRIAFGVFLGNLLFGILAALVYGISQAH
jgi:hypothetical protein